MAYTRTWNNAYEGIPDGNDLRSSVDDYMRNLKEDIRERMETVFYWSIQDPITVRPEFSGIMTGKVLMMHASEFTPTRDSIGTAVGIANIGFTGGLSYATTSGGTLALFGGLLLPETAVVTNISGLFQNATGSTNIPLSVKLNAKDYSASTNGQQGLITAPATLNPGEIRTVSQTGNVPIAADKIYYITVEINYSAGASPVFFGVKVTYDVPTAEALR